MKSNVCRKITQNTYKQCKQQMAICDLVADLGNLIRMLFLFVFERHVMHFVENLSPTEI